MIQGSFQKLGAHNVDPEMLESSNFYKRGPGNVAHIFGEFRGPWFQAKVRHQKNPELLNVGPTCPESLPTAFLSKFGIAAPSKPEAIYLH